MGRYHRYRIMPSLSFIGVLDERADIQRNRDGGLVQQYLR